ncbi:MAG: STAS domain-containing protein, partial [Acutalibacteraceae bacterium]|nr:STAS domain-containing protein [Acutalibacteraceae bacterium]
MQIKKTMQGKEIILYISGRIDSTNVQELNEVCEQIEFDKIERLVVDFSDVAYISSVVLRSLLVLRKKAGEGKLLVANVNSMVEEIFSTTGFSQILDYTSVEEDTSWGNMSFKAFLAYKQEHGVK